MMILLEQSPNVSCDSCYIVGTIVVGEHDPQPKNPSHPLYSIGQS